MLGDYIDRGPDSRAVLDLLISRSQSRLRVLVRTQSSDSSEKIN
jgi:hypothetical protein